MLVIFLSQDSNNFSTAEFKETFGEYAGTAQNTAFCISKQNDFFFFLNLNQKHMKLNAFRIGPSYSENVETEFLHICLFILCCQGQHSLCHTSYVSSA